MRGWLFDHGLDQLSPPEAEHVLLELPAERAQYLGLLSDITGWPERMPLARRIPSDAEVQKLNRVAGKWRAVTLLDDELALRMAALLFRRVFILDPLYDSGDLLYAAWHDPVVKAENAQRLAEQAALTVRAAPLLRDATAVLAPDHLPGSWDPRPGWRRPRADAEQRLQEAWALRATLVLLNWADRLDALVLVARPDVVQQVPVALGVRQRQCAFRLREPPELSECMHMRGSVPELTTCWASARRLARRRSQQRLGEIACVIEEIGKLVAPTAMRRPWQLLLGEQHLADPALLLRRVLNGTDPHRLPELPPSPLRRRPLCLVSRAARAA